jgi:type II secretory pathway component PulF
MATFKYRGKHINSGEVSQGSIEAGSEQEARKILRGRGLTPMSLSKSWGRIGGPKRVQDRDLIMIAKTMSKMLKAGVSFGPAMRSLLENPLRPEVRLFIQQVLTDVEQGSSTADAFKRHERILPRIVPALVEVGEETGEMDTMFDRMALLLSRLERTRRQLRGAMRQPKIILTFAGLAMMFLTVKTIPAFAKVFIDAGVELPITTVIVLKISDFLINHYAVVAISVVTAWIAWNRIQRIPAVRRKADEWALKLPYIRDIVRMGQISQFARILEALIGSGADTVRSLTLSSETLTNTVLKEAVLRARGDIADGESMTGALKNSGQFLPMAITMMAVGEQNGYLEEMLKDLSEVYEEKVDESIEAFMAILAPTMLVLVAAAVLVILTAVYLPMLNLIQTIQS